MINKKKGFTIVELLVTIVIIGLLFTLGYFSITALLNRADTSYYNSQEDMIVLAGRDYFHDYRSELPKEIGETNFVTLKTLIDEGYIDPVKDRNDHDCDYEGSIVTVQKITNSEYQYYVTLICDNDNYETSKDEADPVIKFTPNKESSTEAITVKMEVTDNVGVASYRYVIIKEGETYYDSDYQVYNGEVTINLTEKGLYTIIGYAIDTSGNRGDRESGKYSIYQGIDCANVEFNNSVAGETWTNKNIDIDIKVPENTYRFEVSYRMNGGEYVPMDDYVGAVNPKFTISDEGKTQIRVVAYDSEGNSCVAVSKEYYIDKTKPSCNIDVSGTTGENGWYKSDVTLSLNRTDNLSGATQYGLTTSTNVSYNGSDSRNQGDTNGTTWYGYVKDEAGNTSSCSVSVKVDTTIPTCSVNFSGTSGDNGWYRSGVTVSLSRNDTKSGIVSYGLTTSTNVSYNGYDSRNQGDTNGTTWYGYVKDEAGNTGSCSNTVKADTTIPTCSITVQGTGANGWYNSNAALTLNTSDTKSGVSSYDLTKVSTPSYNGTSTATQGSTPGSTWYGYVKDYAGNTGQCQTTVYVDNQGPSINLVVGSTNGSYNTTNISYSISASDGRSGIDKYCFTTGGTSCTPNSNTTSQTNISGGFSSYDGTTRPMTACVSDKAGNVSCTTRNYTVYNQCSKTVDDGGAICGTYGSCDCNSGYQYATKTQNKKDAYLGVSCPAVVTNNGCSQACSCCSESNPTACQAIYPCRTSTLESVRYATKVYDEPDQGGFESSVYEGTKLYYLGDAGNYSYKVYVTEFKNKSPYHRTGNIAYITRNCVTTDPSAICTYEQCPTLGQ